jgi:photosystem II stability/assembly factor-like uncharacterized protein
VLLAAPALAEDPFTLGPLGGSAAALALDPADGDVLAIAFPDGLLRSTDGGATWSPHGAGLPASPSPSGLFTDPSNPARLYTLVGAKPYRSADFGDTWAPLALTAPATLELLAVAGDGTLLAGTGSSIHRSITDGANWTTVASGITILDALAFAPSAPGTAFYGSLNGVWKSSDGGATWSDPGPYSQWTKALAVDPADPLRVYAGTTTGVQRSLDGGATFAPASTGLPGGTSAQVLRFDLAGTRLWLGALNGVFASSNGGTSWTNANAGLPSPPPIALALAFDAGGDAWLGAEASGGGVWRAPGGLPPWLHVAFAAEPVNDARFAGGQRVVGLYNGAWSAAAGQVVQPTAWQADFGTDTRVLAVDPVDATRWLAGGVGAFIDNAQIAVLTGNGAGAGKVYERFGAGHVRDLAFDPFNPGVVLAGIYLAGFGNESIARSTNSGATWTDVPGTVGWSCDSLAHDPFTPGLVLALLGNNQWMDSANGGASWTVHPAWTPGTGNAAFLAFDPWTPGTLVRGDWGPGAANGVYVSTDDGATWSEVGAITLHIDSDLQVHPDAPGLLWVSDAAGALLVSGDGGASWQPQWTAPDGNVTSIALDAASGALLLGTSAASAWELPGASPYVRLGNGTAGTGGFVPRHFAHGALPQPGAAWTLAADRLLGGSTGFLVASLAEGALPLWGGTLFAAPPWLVLLALPTGGAAGVGGSGALALPVVLPNDPLIVGVSVVTQVACNDAAGVAGRTLSNGLRTTFGP